MIARFHALALDLPFDEVSSVFEQDPPGGGFAFERYDGTFRRGDLYVDRKRVDGERELVHIPALHAVFFFVRVEGGESAPIGLASHPPFVVHREDVIERDADGVERARRIGAGDAVEFAPRRSGWYSWHSFCKTQYAGSPTLGGEANFLKAHLSLIELLDRIREAGAKVRIRDDSKYAAHRNADKLLAELRRWDALIAGLAGRLGDMLGEQGVAMSAPIKDRPDFEHLEAKGMSLLRELAARQRHRKRPPRPT